jgi:hypothetical protein
MALGRFSNVLSLHVHDVDRYTGLHRTVVHGDGTGSHSDASLDNDGSGNRLGCQNVELPGERSHDRHQSAEGQNSDAIRQSLHRCVNTTLRLLRERTQTPRQHAAGRMGHSPRKTPVPAAGGVDLAPLGGKEVGADRRRVRTGYDLLKELIIDDDQRESDSVLGVVGNGCLDGAPVSPGGQVR